MEYIPSLQMVAMMDPRITNPAVHMAESKSVPQTWQSAQPTVGLSKCVVQTHHTWTIHLAVPVPSVTCSTAVNWCAL